MLCTSEREDMEFDKRLGQVNLGKLDVVNLHIDEQQEMSEKLLGVISAPADNTMCQRPSPLSLA